MGEREIGQILEGVKNLNERYTAQEGRLDHVERTLAQLTISFSGQQSRCMEHFEGKFVSKDNLRPIEEMCSTIKKSAIFIFCSLVTVLAGGLIYIERML